MEETLYKSPGGFMSMKSSDSYGSPYYYAERKGVDSIAFLLFRVGSSGGLELGLVNESKPPLNHRLGEVVSMTTAFGGSQDEVVEEKYLKMSEEEKQELMRRIAIRECKEEAGYSIGADGVYSLGKLWLSSMMNQYVYLYAFDVNGLEVGERNPQNTSESLSSVIWVNGVESISCAKALSIYTKLSLVLENKLRDNLLRVFPENLR